MALTARSHNRRWFRFLHFLVRFAGLTGLLAVGIGVAVAYAKEVLTWKQLSSVDFLRSAILGETGDGVMRLAIFLLVGGALAAVLALLVEALVSAVIVAGRRSAFGSNAALQIGLAVVLLVGINVYSAAPIDFHFLGFHLHSNPHYVRADWTQHKQFTLPEKIQDQLRQLQGETTIVVYQRHKTFGVLNDKPDAYDSEAERKVVEKVKDLVEQFREFGPQFKVEVLDTEEVGYEDKLARLTVDAKELREAISSAPENSIFFYASGKVQRLSFNDFYELDKTDSKQRDGGRGNLVLLYQGVEPFARKVLNVDEKRPKIGIAVVHEWLTSEGPEEFGFSGLKKALGSRGFDVRDIVLKKWSEFAPPEPAVYTYEESKFDRLDEQLTELDADIKNLDEDLKQWEKLKEHWQTASLDDLTKENAEQLKRSRIEKVTEPMRQMQLERAIEPQIAFRQLILKQSREEREEVAKEKQAVVVDNLAEQRRMTDLKAKLDRSLADCDLLLIPRMTLRNVIIGDRIPNQVHRLDEAQVASVKDFLAAGKPVLACFGPANEHPSDVMRMAQMGRPGPDEIEELFAKLGIKMGKQTILFNVESKSFAERRSGLLVSGVAVEVPPVDFETKPDAARPFTKPDEPAQKPNPIRSSMRIAAHSLNKNLELRVRYPRPIYYEPQVEQTLDVEPEFMLTNAASWNEEQPFPSRERTPRFEPPKADDANKGTVDEKRRGPFPIGVAVEARLPAEWYADKSDKPATVRVAAVGNGSVFTGTELSPAKEELLLNTCNWLLGRDDLLPRSDNEWSYPRVTLNDTARTIWILGSWIGLPFLFFYLGIVVLLLRLLR